MGQSVPTPTREVADFESRLSAFRRELPRDLRAAYDELLQAAYRTAAARNRAGDMDPRSNILLSMLLHTQAQNRALMERMERLEQHVGGDALGILAGCVPLTGWQAHPSVDQARLTA